MIAQIPIIWENIVKKINDGSLICSSEKSLCFQFAWEIKLKFETANIDFEKRLFDGDFSDGMFLDLFIEDSNYRIGVEFKYMKSDASHNTNQTVTRVKIINDLKRLTYLKDKNKITNGFFLCLTNEIPYTYKGRKEKNKNFRTYHQEEYKANDIFPTHNPHSNEQVACSGDIKFNWNGIAQKGENTYKLANGYKYSWLEAIEI